MPRFNKLLIFIGLLFLTLPVIIFFSNKGTNDIGVWLEWMSHINRWGPLNAYSIININHDYQPTDYPPLSFINLWLALKIASLINISWLFGIKIILLIYYFATWIVLIYLTKVTSARSVRKSIVVASSLFLGGLYFAINSEALSYLDITFAPFVIFSLVLFAQRKYFLSGICLALAILTKWIPAFLLPAFLFYFISKKDRVYKIDLMSMAKFLIGIVFTAVSLLIIFLLNRASLLSLLEAINKTLNRQSPTLSPGALNFHWIVQYIIELMYPITNGVLIWNNYNIFQTISAVIYLIISAVILKKFLGMKKNMVSLLQASLMISWSYFIWRTGVHENHLFVVVLIALCLAILKTTRNNLQQYFWLCFIGLANYFVFFGIPFKESSFLVPKDATILTVKLTLVIAVLHLSIYLIYFRKFLQLPYLESRNDTPEKKRTRNPKQQI